MWPGRVAPVSPGDVEDLDLRQPGGYDTQIARKKAERRARRDRRTRKKRGEAPTAEPKAREKAPAGGEEHDITINGEITIDGTRIKVDKDGKRWQVIDDEVITVEQTGEKSLRVIIEEEGKRKRGKARRKKN